MRCFIDEADREKARDIARHEAGHLVAARRLGLLCLRFEVRRERVRGSSVGYYGFAELSTILQKGILGEDGLEVFLKQRIIVLNAGAIAEALENGTVDEAKLSKIRSTNGEHDDAKAKELFAIFLNLRIGKGENNEDFRSSEKWMQHPFWVECDEAAKRILLDSWDAVEKVVDHTLSRLSDCDRYSCNADQFSQIAWPHGEPERMGVSQ